ncbi:1,4-alpha-glucan branching protein GlgB [Anaerotignum faecicola]|uniref:1,4-alpha-glucan branching enzyme GlgB n=1 Tax=Anaerotignum faecicola TaxID=2358141 RepID=A0A401LC95_9FIRM|nr:1,4-alpha-glucan branching protein GlgB [Anaerotignum faecicola]GCB29084.1 1,4-alpha-glucan branching enzyme GlgB [Anaerotignum faecicola]
MLTTTKLYDIFHIVNGEHSDPHTVLGMHEMEEDGRKAVVVRAFLPNAAGITVIDYANKRKKYPMERLHADGFFEVTIADREEWFRYQLEYTDADGNTWRSYDPYSFSPTLSEFDRHLFGAGTHYEIYEKMGGRLMTHEGARGAAFSVWAPNAKAVSVIGDFNNWDARRSPMRRLGESGIWELFLPAAAEGDKYKFHVTQCDGRVVDKTDPYGVYAEVRPNNASVLYPLKRYKWKDRRWMTARRKYDFRTAPMNIYEVHLGSWKRAEGDRFLTYTELAEQLIPYVKEMGYTHIEMLPVEEHPFDGSWGYQVTGYYAPTSRYGSPDEFKQFVDACHQNGISVILDWVPAHFPKDDFALARFDGTALYEHQDPRLGEHIQWGTYIFNYGRKEVANFLLANALYWMDIFHIDGLRVDAVASLLRLDFCKEEGQWLPNVYGGSENLEAIEFLKHMNSVIAEREPGALMIAEDSTAWPGVTKKVDEGGLGFSLKWNMGWMNDFLSYIKLDPIYRKYHQNKLTFGMAYHYAENFVLVLSHDEVVHTKSSMIGKMPGDVWQSFANLRLSYGFMMGHPGKKLLFMGGEFAQYSEWSEARSLDWHLLQYADHQEMQAYVKELNHLYAEESAFWAEDFDPNGFQWIECDDAESSIVSFVRRSQEKELVFLCNFTPVVHRGFSLGVPQEGVYHERLNSDAARFGGSDVINAVPLQSRAEPAGRCPFRVELDVPPLGMVILEREQPKKQPRAKKPKTRTAANGTKTDAKRKHPEKNTEKTAKQADLP